MFLFKLCLQNKIAILIPNGKLNQNLRKKNILKFDYNMFTFSYRRWNEKNIMLRHFMFQYRKLNVQCHFASNNNTTEHEGIIKQFKQHTFGVLCLFISYPL